MIVKFWTISLMKQALTTSLIEDITTSKAFFGLKPQVHTLLLEQSQTYSLRPNAGNVVYQKMSCLMLLVNWLCIIALKHILPKYAKFAIGTENWNVSLPSLPMQWNYHLCKSQNYIKTDGRLNYSLNGSNSIWRLRSSGSIQRMQ